MEYVKLEMVQFIKILLILFSSITIFGNGEFKLSAKFSYIDNYNYEYIDDIVENIEDQYYYNSNIDFIDLSKNLDLITTSTTSADIEYQNFFGKNDCFLLSVQSKNKIINQKKDHSNFDQMVIFGVTEQITDNIYIDGTTQFHLFFTPYFDYSFIDFGLDLAIFYQLSEKFLISTGIKLNNYNRLGEKLSYFNGYSLKWDLTSFYYFENLIKFISLSLYSEKISLENSFYYLSYINSISIEINNSLIILGVIGNIEFDLPLKLTLNCNINYRYSTWDDKDQFYNIRSSYLPEYYSKRRMDSTILTNLSLKWSYIKNINILFNYKFNYNSSTFNGDIEDYTNYEYSSNSISAILEIIL